MHSTLFNASPPVTRSGRVGNARLIARGVAPASSGNSSVEEPYSRTSLDLSSSSNSFAFSAPLSWTSPSSGSTGGLSNASGLSPSLQAVGFETEKKGEVKWTRKKSQTATKGLLSLKLGAVDRNVDQVSDISQSKWPTSSKDIKTGAHPWDLSTLQRKYPVFCDPLVVTAYKIASHAHSGQVRKNGDPALAHSTETALILAELCEDPTIISAALLHDVLDDTQWTEKKLSAQVPWDVCELIRKVSAISFLSQLVRDHRVVRHQNRTNKVRDMLVGASDCRAVLIKLADRLHNLRTISALPFVKQARIAEETMEVFVPLAGRLGCWTLKSELEDLCFRVVLPQEYKNLKAQYDEFIDERKSLHLGDVLSDLKSALDEKGISYEDIVGRPKNIYGVYKKMIKRRTTRLTDVYDLLAIRVIVSEKESCYKVLRTVHELWQAVEGRHKNYIRHPKKNGYQSIHDVVLTEDGIPFEVQIRTAKMHHIAEHGMAAHWRYKEAEHDDDNDFVQAKVVWSRFILSYLLDLNDRKARPDGVDGYSHSGGNWARMFCTFREKHNTYQPCRHHAMHCPHPVTEADFHGTPLLLAFHTPDGLEVCSVPHKTTVGAFLREHMNDDSTALGVPRVNGIPVPMDTMVRFGDVVEISDGTWGNECEELDVFTLGSLAPFSFNAGPNCGKVVHAGQGTSNEELLKAFVPRG